MDQTIKQKRQAISDVYRGKRQSSLPVERFALHKSLHSRTRPQQYISEIILSTSVAPQKQYARFYRTFTPVATVIKAAQKPNATVPLDVVYKKSIQISRSDMLYHTSDEHSNTNAAPKIQVQPIVVCAPKLSINKLHIPKPKIKLNKLSIANVVIVSAVLMSSILGYMSYSYHVAIKKVEAQPAISEEPTLSDTSSQDILGEQSDTSIGSLSEHMPSAAGAYAASKATDAPYKLSISKIKVSANISGMGITKTGAIAAPSNIWQVGWYKTSAKPKDNTGVVLLNGHVHGPTKLGVFANLKSLKTGDTITVTDTAGIKYNYRVVSKSIHKVGEDESSMYQSVSPDKQGLNLVTCDGKIIDGHYEDRLVVFAERV